MADIDWDDMLKRRDWVVAIDAMLKGETGTFADGRFVNRLDGMGAKVIMSIDGVAVAEKFLIGDRVEMDFYHARNAGLKNEFIVVLSVINNRGFRIGISPAPRPRPIINIKNERGEQ